MTASDSNSDFRQRLLEIIDRSGVSDRRLSLVATSSADTVRNMRRGSSPRLDSLEALCRVLGLQLETAPLDEPGQPAEGPPCYREATPIGLGGFREEIRQDLVEILDRAVSSGDLGWDLQHHNLRSVGHSRVPSTSMELSRETSPSAANGSIAHGSSFLPGAPS